MLPRVSQLSINNEMKKKDRPNFLHIFADEMRSMATSYAGNPNLTTPNMDRLAQEGATFSRMYTSSPLCSPARSSMMTGLFPNRTGVLDNEMRMRTDVSCIAELTRDSGYQTAHIGKWHLEGTDGGEAAYDFIPPQRHRGFDFWAGFEHGHRYWSGSYHLKEEKPIFYRNYEPDVQTEQAIEFIKKNRKDPWHLDLSWGPPHFPLAQAKPEDIARFEPADIKLRPNVPIEYAIEARQDYASYYAMIVNLDWNLGRILTVLDELDMVDNTIVVFTSDHGDMLFSHGQHYKRRPQEESVRVPFLIRYPKKIQKGRVIDTLSSLVDEVPTILDLMEIERSDLDGTSHYDFLMGGDYASPPDSVYMQCPRLGCRSYDPGLFSPNSWRAVRTERYKAVYLLTDENESIRMIQLFDLYSDPFESDNLVQNSFDKRVVSKMNQTLISWIDKTDDNAFQGKTLKDPDPTL